MFYAAPTAFASYLLWNDKYESIDDGVQDMWVNQSIGLISGPWTARLTVQAARRS